MSETTQLFKRQLPKNALMSVLSFLTYSVSAIWLTPYLVKHIGAAAYGLVPLAGLFTQYATIITSNLSGAVNRFLTVELQKAKGNPNVVFNSALFLFLFLFAIQLPVFSLGLFYAEKLFDIPPELKNDALLLLGCSAVSFLISQVSGVFGVSLYARNRLDIGSSLELGRLIARLGLIVLLFSVDSPKLRYIGYVDLMLSLVMFGASIIVWRKLTPELFISLSLRRIDWKILAAVFHMSVWTMINQLGSLLYLRTDIWIINRFISPVAAGQYAAVLVVANFVRQIGLLFSAQLGPTVMGYWAAGDLVNLRRLLASTIKILAIILAVPVGFISCNGGRILSVWLGPDFESLSPVLFILMIHLPFTTSIFPVGHLQMASKSVRFPAMVTFVMGILNVILSYVLGVTMDMGILGVALATAIMLMLRNALVLPLHSAYILNAPARMFFVPLCWSLVMLGVVYALAHLPIAGLLGINSSGLFGLLVNASFVCLVSVLIGWFLILTRHEKSTMLGMLPDSVRRWSLN